MSDRHVGVLGATSLVGGHLLLALHQLNWKISAFSRDPHSSYENGLRWYTASPNLALDDHESIPAWVCLAPIWVLPDYFDALLASGAKRVVALSSTSLVTKHDSQDLYERDIVSRLKEGEKRLADWAQANNIEFVILRPTLIYGGGRDKNVAEIAAFIRRFGFFPLFGRAHGLRQPIHAQDVALACLAALSLPPSAHHTYPLTGGETLSYRAMVERIFAALHRPLRIVTVPLWVFRVSVGLARLLPRYRHWSASMAIRMNSDLTFDSIHTNQDLSIAPRPFRITQDDLGI